MGAVTIATNMAGRGTDVKLGGNLEMRLKKELTGIEDEVLRAAKETKVRAEIAEAHEGEAGRRLFVIGTDATGRRVDNQLRGRSGRQGDPESRFFLSLEDDLMRMLAPTGWAGCCSGRAEGWRGDRPSVDQQALEKAQKKVEARNFDTRKNVLKYDDVMNSQRKSLCAAQGVHAGVERVRDCGGDARRG